MRPHREIEIKLRVDDLSELLRKVHALGARTLGRVREYNVLFDTPDAAFRLTGWLVRLRMETPAAAWGLPAGRRSAVVTSKAPAPPRRKGARSPFKERLETEVSARNPRSFRRQVARLGLRPSFSYEKYRATFRIPHWKLHIDLDETPIGTILELEGDPGAIRKVARQLGFSPREFLRVTYWELNAAECRRRGVAPGNMLFRR